MAELTHITDAMLSEAVLKLPGEFGILDLHNAIQEGAPVAFGMEVAAQAQAHPGESAVEHTVLAVAARVEDQRFAKQTIGDRWKRIIAEPEPF